MEGYQILLIYVVATLLFTLISKERGGFVLTRKANWVLLSFSITAGLVGGNTFVIFTGFVNESGVSAMWYFVGLIIGLLILRIFLKNFKGINDIENVSISDYLEHTYDRKVSLLISITNLIRFLCIIVIQLIAGGKLLSQLLDIPYGYAVLIMATTITIYVFIKGFQGVVKSDLAQVLCIIIPLSLVIPSFSKNISFLDSKYLNMGNMSVLKIGTFFLFGVALIIASGDIWQRIICLDKLNSFKKVAGLSSLILIVIGGLISLMGLSSISSGIKNSNEAFLYILTAGTFPRWVINLTALAILSAILSTADTFLMGAATIIGKDFFRKKGESLIDLIRIWIIIIAICSLFFSLKYMNILIIAIILANIVFAMSPFIFLLLIGRKPHKISIIVSVILGLVYIAILILMKKVKVEYSYGSLVISSVSLVLVNIIKTRKIKTGTVNCTSQK